MFNLLNSRRKYYKSMQVTPVPQILFTIDKIRHDLETPMNHYTSREYWVENSNILNRIILSMNLDINMNIFTYIEHIDKKIKWVSRHFKLASPYSHGVFHKKDFYIQHDLYEDYFSFSKTWKTVAPIQPIMTDYASIGLDHPLHMDYAYSINYLDIKALLVQYYYWVREQKEYDRITDTQVFISQYPLSNMIQYYVDLSIIKMAFAKPKKKYKNTHSIYVYDRTNEMANIMKKFRKYAKGNGIFYTAFMNSIPLVTQKTGLDYIRQPLPILNSYNFLIYFMIYGYYIRGMTRVMGKVAITDNANELSDLDTLLRYYRTTRSNTLKMGPLTKTKDEIYSFLLGLENKLYKGD